MGFIVQELVIFSQRIGYLRVATLNAGNNYALTLAILGQIIRAPRRNRNADAEKPTEEKIAGLQPKLRLRPNRDRINGK
jgi:hypothetical protein